MFGAPLDLVMIAVYFRILHLWNGPRIGTQQCSRVNIGPARHFHPVTQRLASASLYLNEFILGVRMY